MVVDLHDLIGDLAVIIEAIGMTIQNQGPYKELSPDMNGKILAAQNKLRAWVMNRPKHRLIPVDLKQPELYQIAIQYTYAARFLGFYRGQYFVSKLKLLSYEGRWESSITPNCKAGWLYVDSGKEAVGVESVDLLYYIDGANDD